MIPRILSAALALLIHSQVQAIEAGAAVPDCNLQALGEEPATDLRQFQGKVVYIDFWASWCGPCVRSFRFMNALDHEFHDKGLEVVAINLDEKREDARSFLTKQPARFTLAADATGQCPRSFGVQAMPSSYLVDRQGIIRHVHLGFRRGEAEQLRELVEQLLAERPAGQ